MSRRQIVAICRGTLAAGLIFLVAEQGFSQASSKQPNPPPPFSYQGFFQPGGQPGLGWNPALPLNQLNLSPKQKTSSSGANNSDSYPPYYYPGQMYGGGYGSNSYMMFGGGYGSNPYMIGVPAPSVRYPGVTYAGVYSPYGYGNYGSAQGNGSERQGGSMTSRQKPSSAGQSMHVLLNSLGIPNEDGRPIWPVGLCILPPATESQSLREQLDGLLQVAALQATCGSVNPRLIREAEDTVRQLRTMLNRKSEVMSHDSYENAKQYLRKLEHAFKALR